jgi:hypothetical protein
MDTTYEIIIRNKRIYDYYKKNPGINVETMNLILLDLMERLSVDMTALLQNTFQGQLLSEVKDVKKQLLSEVKEMRQQITSFHDSLSTRINKTNEDFIEKTKLVFSLSTSDNKEHMTQLLNRNSDMFIERLNSIIPKTNEEMNKKIQDQLSLVHKSIQLDIQQYLNKTDTPLTEFISSFDSKLSSIQQPIFSFITNQGQIMSDVKDIKQTVGSMQDHIIITLQENNRSFLETTKLIISASNNENTEKITNILNNSTEVYIDKIRTSLPTMHDELARKIQEQLLLSQKTIECELKQYLTNKSDTSLKDFISSFDSKLSSIQQPIFSLINSNQDNISTKIGNVKDDLLLTKNATEKLYLEMNEYLNRYKSSSQFKGAVSEKNLHDLLVNMFSQEEILITTGIPQSGDFILKKDNEEYIMFETKSYQTNVDIKEVDKFQRDVRNKKLHSIMMSQHTGIVSKRPYEIEINEFGCILIYLHKVNFSQEKVKQAIDIIENMAPKIKQITEEEYQNGIIIDKDVLNRINKEFITFLDNKEKLKNFLKEQNKMACIQVDSLEMPDLGLVLKEKFPTSEKCPIHCGKCGYGCHNKKQLSNHQRSCHPSSKENITQEIEINEDINVSENKFSQMNLSQLKEECKKRKINTSGKKKEDLIDMLI